MKLLFLDIDGVLNNLGTVAAFGNPSKFLDPVSIGLIDRLCRETDTKIVVSSSWRIGNTEKLRDELRELGAGSLAERIIGETPRTGNCRGDEIAAYLAEHPCDRYVIVDDDSDMLPDQPFVKTTFEDGFRFTHWQQALRILDPTHRDSRIFI